MAVGRNDPCPCGSGKKYKNCCMRNTRMRESKEVLSARQYVETISQLYDFASTPDLLLDLMAGFGLFWNSDYSLAMLSHLTHQHGSRFVDWYTFEYPTSREKKTILQLYIDALDESLRTTVGSMLEQWRGSRLSLFEIQDAVPNRSLQLVDLWKNGVVMRAQQENLSRVAVPGDLVLGRILEVGGVTRLAFGTALLPAFVADGMIDFVERAWQAHHEVHPNASREVFLGQSGYLFNHYLMQLALAEESTDWDERFYQVADAMAVFQELGDRDELDLWKELLGLSEEEKEQEEPLPFKTIADGRLILPSKPEPSDPDPDQEGRTFAGGKLLLP